MVSLIREYVTLLLEQSAKNTNEIRGVVLSQLAEFATVTGLGGQSYSFSSAVEKLNAEYQTYIELMTPPEKNVLAAIYNEFIRLASAAKDDANVGIPPGKVMPQNVGTTTAPVDVIIKSGKIEHEVHVKLNDPSRLIGLQGETKLTADLLASELNTKWKAATKFKWYRNQFSRQLLNLKKDPVGQSSYQLLQSKKQHRVMFTNKDVRRNFLDYLAKNNLPEEILDEVKVFFAKASSRKIFFFKYKTTPDPASFNRPNIVSLQVSNLKADPNLFGIVENSDDSIDPNDPDLSPAQKAQVQHATTTRLYTITYADNPIFVVETRSGSHPMQLKVFSTRIKMDNIYDEISFT